MNNTLTKTAHIDYHQVLDLTSPCTPKVVQNVHKKELMCLSVVIYFRGFRYITKECQCKCIQYYFAT